MSKQKRYQNITTINLTHKNVMLLRKLGYLNNKNQKTELNKSEFINRAIDNYISIEWPELDEEINLKLLLARMKDIEKQRDLAFKKFECDARETAQAIAKAREKINNTKRIIEIGAECVDPVFEVINE